MKYRSILFIILIFFTACATTKYVPEDKFLLSKVKVKINDKRITKSEAMSFVKQKPNSSALGINSFYLRLYNLSGRDTTKAINRLFRNLGEAPVIYDSIQAQRTVIQLGRFMETKGFYNSEVTVQTELKKKKAQVTYSIKANEPKIIDHIFLYKDSLQSSIIGKRNMGIELADTSAIRQILFQEQKNAKILPSDLLDVDKLKAERERLEQLYKSKGYYFFDKDNVHFYLDTSKNNNKATIYYGIRSENLQKLRKFKIRAVNVFLGIEARDSLILDSLTHKGIKIFFKNKLPYNPEVLTKSIAIYKGAIYNPKDVEETKDRLSLLQQFRYSNISFQEVPSDDSLGLLDCFVQLIPSKRQAYGIEGTVTLNSGDFGFASSINYKHRNLFNGAELFSVELSGGMERVRGSENTDLFNVKELGGAVSLSTPKFFLPFLKMKRWRTKNPRTNFSIRSNYTKRPEYVRRITDLLFNYQWKTSRSFTHIITPVDLGILKVKADEKFLNHLNNYYRQTSYVDHIIPAGRYTLFFNNKGNRNKTTYQRLRFNFETAGFLFNNVLDRIFRRDNKEDIVQNDYHSYFGIRYAQYLRSDVEFTYNQFINPKHAIVYHTFMGIGYPYGNSNVMPFEKMYFAGGANSMRAWQPRSLGPGGSKKYNPTERFSYGEIKLEGNIEYRFTLRGALEGAFFVDMGNVWNWSDIAKRDADSRFVWSEFYKQIAIGSGLGLRYNIRNIIVRFDAAVKVKDPYLEGNSLVKSYKWKDISFNFGIGYPF